MALTKVASLQGQTKTKQLVTLDQVEEIEMSIVRDAVPIQFIIDRLTDLYPKPIISLVRELVSNAIDATMLMPLSMRVPVEVFSPTTLNPTFKIIDHGVGMSIDDVRLNYSQYGGTTKREDFNQIGSFGLGAKSPLAYCTEFTVITTKDGITTEFIVTRTSKGNKVKIISSAYTGKTSGTKITIPVKINDIVEFQEAISTYKVFTPDIPIIIDSISHDNSNEFVQISEVVLDDDSGVTGRIWIKKDNYLNFLESEIPPIHFILSGWLYSDQKKGTVDYEKGIFVELKPGVVDFSSSRDEITQNDRLKNLKKKISDAVFHPNNVDHQQIFELVMKSLSREKYFFNMVKLYDRMNKENQTVNFMRMYYSDEQKIIYGDFFINLNNVVSEDGFSFIDFINSLPSNSKNILYVCTLEHKDCYGYSLMDKDENEKSSKFYNNKVITRSYSKSMNNALGLFENNQRFSEHTLIAQFISNIFRNKFDNFNFIKITNSNNIRHISRSKKEILEILGANFFNVFITSDLDEKTKYFFDLISGNKVNYVNDTDIVEKLKEIRSEKSRIFKENKKNNIHVI